MALPSLSPSSPILATSSQRLVNSQIHDHVPLPGQVEGLIAKICLEQGIDQPDNRARLKLYQLGEDVCMDILRKIEKTKVRKTFSALLMYLAKQHELSPGTSINGNSVPSSLAHGMFQPSSTPSANILNSPPTAPTTPQPVFSPTPTIFEKYGAVHRRLDFTELANPTNNSKANMPTMEHKCQEDISPQMLALGELEFWKAFLILSYLGRAQLEKKVTVEYIESLKYFPMERFELEIFNKLGGNHVSSFDRRKNFQWNASKTYVYCCHVDLNGNATFKGPFLEPDQTHLQRMLGDDNVLQVTFEEEKLEAKKQQHTSCILNNYSDVYQRVAQEGIMLGLRRYRFLVYKDGGKEESKKNPTSSSVKCYFVRTDSGWARDQADFLCGKTVNEIRLAFMHIHTVPSLAKYVSRLPLILSKTMKLNIDLSIVKVEPIDDIPCMDGTAITKGIHTDGTGFISEDLALQCPLDIFKGNPLKGTKSFNKMECQSSKRQRSSYNEAPPLLLQVRLFNKGLAAKGTLLINRKLPPNTIQIRPSMVKVESDSSVQNIQQFNSLEVVTTSYRPKKAHLSKFLISLLHYGGVPSEFFLGLLLGELVGIENRFSDRGAAINVVKFHSGIDDDALLLRMLYANVPLNEPFLKSRLTTFMGEEHKGLQECKIPISNAYYLMGTADPTGTLGPNQVCIILDEGQLSGEVLVYKHPGLHTGDMHKLHAKYVPELEDIVGNSKYGIFFPTVGPRSLADEMANSDFDGDIYWVSQHPELLKTFTPSKPWQAPEDPPRTDTVQHNFSNMRNDDLERLLFEEFLKNRFFPSHAIGTAAECWLAYMDRVLTPDLGEEEKNTIEAKMEELVNIYYKALDAGKSGEKVKVPENLKVTLYPHFMGKKSSYDSTSILGEIYDKVESFKSERLQITDILPLSCFVENIPISCTEKWKSHYKNYLIEMSGVMGSFSDSPSNELCPELKEARNISCQQIFDKYKEILYGGVKDFRSSTRPHSDIYNEACAIYEIAYAKANESKKVKYCGFAWRVAGDALCELYIITNGGNPGTVDLNVLREPRW